MVYISFPENIRTRYIIKIGSPNSLSHLQTEQTIPPTLIQRIYSGRALLLPQLVWLSSSYTQTLPLFILLRFKWLILFTC